MIEALSEVGYVALQGETSAPAITGIAAAGLAVGLAGIGAGYAERGIGAAAIGALAEDSISLGNALLMTVLPETIVILAMVVFFIVQFLG
jgi:V/A-type H+-transporting ATPase subunit K